MGEMECTVGKGFTCGGSSTMVEEVVIVGGGRHGYEVC